MYRVWRKRIDGIVRRMWVYSPHRALVALGLILTSMAAGSGILGAFNSDRAQSSAAAVNRYLVLQPPVRDMRASVAAFQVLAEQAFSGLSISAATLASAEVDSTSTDQAYVTMQRALSPYIRSGLAPSLGSLEATYVTARGGLGALLAAGVRNSQTAAIAATETTAEENLDAALGTLQENITDRLIRANDQTRADALVARDDLLWCLVIGVPVGMAVILVLARKALRVERHAAQGDAARAEITQRNEFEGQLQQGLEMAKSETAAFDMVTQALSDATPGLDSELLLADSSRAHFRQVLVTPTDRTTPGCGVVSPNDCPAASRGQTMVFPMSTAINACPNLRGRACSALCVPVSIGGNSAGVIHVTAIDGTPPADAIRRDVEVIARRASERFAMLRAFEVSETQANSDSLTGLLTRRSLESSIRDLQSSGVPYAVAYGDLDHFKQLNDVFGHSAGDRALRTFSQVLRDGLRPADIASRYGGEEFVIVLPNCATTEAVSVLERVRERLADRLNSGRLPNFTVSFGVSVSDEAPDFEGLVALADGALLKAKSAGRDRILVSADFPPGVELQPIRPSDHSTTTPDNDSLSIHETTPSNGRSIH